MLEELCLLLEVVDLEADLSHFVVRSFLSDAEKGLQRNGENFSECHQLREPQVALGSLGLGYGRLYQPWLRSLMRRASSACDQPRSTRNWRTRPASLASGESGSFGASEASGRPSRGLSVGTSNPGRAAARLIGRAGVLLTGSVGLRSNVGTTTSSGVQRRPSF